MSNSTALVPVAYQSIAGDSQAALQFIDTIGDAFSKGGLVGCKTPGQGKMLALTCLCEGITPLEFIRTYHLIDGKPTMRADAMLAKFKGAGGKVRWLNVGDDGHEARAEFTHDGQTLELNFTFDQARRMGVVKKDSAWDKDPGAMLRARLISKAVRILAPEIVAGVYAPEEIEESFVEGKVTRTRKPAAASSLVTQSPSGNGSHAAPHTAAEDADFDVVSTAEAPFGEPDAAASQEAGESFVEEETGANDTLPTKDCAASEPAAQPHAVIENGTIRSSEPAKTDPAIINEIRDLAGSDPTLRMIGQRALGEYGLNEVRSLTDIQARQTLALILTHKAGLGERLHKALEKFGTHDITKLTAAQANDMIGALRAKIRKDAEAAADSARLGPALAGAAAGN